MNTRTDRLALEIGLRMRDGRMKEMIADYRVLRIEFCTATTKRREALRVEIARLAERWADWRSMSDARLIFFGASHLGAWS